MCCAALSQAPRASGILDTFEDQGNDLIYEVSRLPGDPNCFVVTGRYLSDGTAMDAVPLRFSSRERAVAQARALAQETLYR
jgi:hypothetical protein